MSDPKLEELFTEGWRRGVMLRIHELEEEVARLRSRSYEANRRLDVLEKVAGAYAPVRLDEFLVTHPTERGDPLAPIPFTRPVEVICLACKSTQFPDKDHTYCGNCGRKLGGADTLPPPCSPSSEGSSSSSSSYPDPKTGEESPKQIEPPAICACGYNGVGPHITRVNCKLRNGLVCWCGGHASVEAVAICACPCHKVLA